MATVAQGAAAATRFDAGRGGGGGGGSGKNPAKESDSNMSQLNDSPLQTAASQLAIIGQLSLTHLVDLADDECLIVRVSQDKSLWAVGLASGKIQLYTTESCTLVYSLDPPDRKEKETVTSLAFVPSPSQSQPVSANKQQQQQQRQSRQAINEERPERRHTLLAGYATGQLRLWHYTGVANQLLWTQHERVINEEGVVTNETNQLLSLACSPDGQRCVTGGSDAAIRVYDLRKRSILGLCQSSFSTNRIDGHRSRVCSLIYHPLGGQDPDNYGHLFLSGGWDDTVQIWDDRKQRSLWVYSGPHICGTDAIDVDPLHNHILTASWQRHQAMLQIWKFKEGLTANKGKQQAEARERAKSHEEMLRARPLGELQQDPQTAPSMGYVAHWLSEQYMVFAGSNANVIKIVDRANMNVVASVSDFAQGVYSVASLLPEGAEARKFAKLAACCGSRLYVLRFERK